MLKFDSRNDVIDEKKEAEFPTPGYDAFSTNVLKLERKPDPMMTTGTSQIQV